MLKKFAIIFVLLIGLTTSMSIAPKQAEAAGYYYDASSGHYVVNVNGAAYSGKSLNSSLPGSVARKLKDAAVRRYGSISSGRTYYFNYKNIVTPYGKYGGSTWTGRVTGVVCTGRR
ncbi:hypothetical protein [Enterococcus faecalis]|uniref:hypothetical protein n=1 Tax=Enterococcus faecalis TaxID=1351 RepID=UPI002A4D2433|nr:hypothetical protein [Enterococcus faecalis]EJG4482917.1 hypothetical protein [Enterococcus faecalis]EKL7559047.1 hypothetical protein [Enterococcus faecalis]MEB7954653.1 hypothetical protein [Enterococcus faecalis]MEB7964825.1 hypothetical protein [Enterococcus faecalis]MEB8141082.1 hypothetical protein [Enterococcus faecalis]